MNKLYQVNVSVDIEETYYVYAEDHNVAEHVIKKNIKFDIKDYIEYSSDLAKPIFDNYQYRILQCEYPLDENGYQLKEKSIAEIFDEMKKQQKEKEFLEKNQEKLFGENED